MPEIVPFLWFDRQAEEAMAFYTSIFDDSRIGHVERYPDESLDPHFAGMGGKVISGSFELCGQPFMCLDGGPQFTFTPAISFVWTGDDAASVEATWQRLSDGGSVLMDLQAYPWSPLFGWVQDRFGLSWQLMVASEKPVVQRITPSLLFTGLVAGRAEEAIAEYTTLFANSAVESVTRAEDGAADKPGLVQRARFHLDGHQFLAGDSTGPHEFTFNEAVSLFVSCQDQAEIDRYWHALTARGAESQCGWCKDAYGVSWQIVPANLGELLSAGPAAVQAMMQMRKFDIAALRRAGAGA